MREPAHSDPAAEPTGDANIVKDRAHPDRAGDQRTLLLSDVPDAASLMPEAAEASRTSHAAIETTPNAVIPSSRPQFPTLDLTPLSQRYELLAEAGHGSMGNVYKARDRETGETVALKLLKPEIASDQSMMERFKKELLFARKITHKNVCRVHEFNRIGGIAYTSMEFVEGESLRSVLNRFGGLPPRKGLDIALQMCSALQEAHAQGIVHRDLKPENVMVDTQGNVKIMDFGIARSMDAMTRLTGSMVGTPAYMAPEQVAGKQVDFRTDIYALGLILYEIFTGQPAFQAENAVAVALKQMRETPQAPHELESSIPFGIERAIMKCLQKDPAQRFQSVGQLADALRAPAAGVSNAAAAAPLPAANLAASTNRVTNSTGFAPHPLYGASALSAEPKRRSKSGWVLLVILLVGGAYAAMRWNQVVQAARVYEPLTRSAAEYYYAQVKSFVKGSPQQTLQFAARTGAEAASDASATRETPPDTSSSVTQAADNGASEPADRNSSDASHKPSKQATESVASAAPGGSASTNATESTAQPAPAATSGTPKPVPFEHPKRAATAVQQRADAAFGENTLSVPPVNDTSPRFLWIGRFETEDRAQERARKVEGLGLPVIVIPRRNVGGEFFIVLSGPFGPERVESVMVWLKKQGFGGVRVLKNPIRNGRLVPGVEQDPEN
ncbi:MAG: protein kinase [Acidobacteriota bacterium]|nr:protein kinase [Acidobacteriota bacterium]